MQIFYRKGLKACRYWCLWGVLESSPYGEQRAYLELREHARGTLVTLWGISASFNNTGMWRETWGTGGDELMIRWRWKGEIAREHFRGQGQRAWQGPFLLGTESIHMTGGGPGSWWHDLKRGISILSIWIIYLSHLLAWALKCISLICRGWFITAVSVPLLTMAIVGWDRTDLAFFLLTQQ